jgi:hypothetical protein
MFTFSASRPSREAFGVLRLKGEMKMQDKTGASRRDALGIASIAAILVLGGEAAEARPAKTGRRPSMEELARARRLYGGELGGFKGGR